MIVKENLLLGYGGTHILEPRNTGTAQDIYNYQQIDIPTNLKENQTYTLCFKFKQYGGSGNFTVGLFNKTNTVSAAEPTYKVSDKQVFVNFTYEKGVIDNVLIYADVAGKTRGVGAEIKDIILVEGHFERGGNEIVYLPHKDNLPEDKQALLPPEGNFKEISDFITKEALNPYATKEELSNYVEKVDGKGLSTNDFTDEQKTKVDNIPDDPKYTDTQYSVGDGLKVADNEISVDSAKVMTMDSWNTSIGPSFSLMINDAMLKNQKDQMPLAIWVGTQQEYDAIVHLNDTTLYFIKE